MAYQERLWAPLQWWLVGLVFASGMALAVWAYLGPTFGIAATVLFLGTVAALLVSYGAVGLQVDGSGVRAGNNQVDWRWLGDCEALDEAATTRILGRDADPRAHLVTRPYIKTAVRVGIDDPADPHPYWLVSTRNPAAFVAAYQHERIHP